MLAIFSENKEAPFACFWTVGASGHHAGECSASGSPPGQCGPLYRTSKGLCKPILEDTQSYFHGQVAARIQRLFDNMTTTSERMIEIIGAYKVGALEPNIVSFYDE